MPRENMTFEEDVIDRLARIEENSKNAAEDACDTKADVKALEVRVTALEQYRWKAAGIVGLVLSASGIFQLFEYLKGHI